jgi:hypothetical protein
LQCAALLSVNNKKFTVSIYESDAVTPCNGSKVTIQKDGMINLHLLRIIIIVTVITIGKTALFEVLPSLEDSARFVLN